MWPLAIRERLPAGRFVSMAIEMWANFRVDAMKIRMIAACMLLFSLPCIAQMAVSSAEQRAALIHGLERGRVTNVNGEQYQHLPGVLAVERQRHGQSADQLLTLVGADSGAFIENKGEFVLFRSSRGWQTATLSTSGAGVVYPAVLNTRTNTIGLLLGTLEVKLNNMSNVEAIATAHSLELVKAFPHLGTVYYRVKAGSDVLDAAAVVGSDSRVVSASPEILESVQIPF